jgi:hypothetical protein
LRVLSILRIPEDSVGAGVEVAYRAETAIFLIAAAGGYLVIELWTNLDPPVKAACITAVATSLSALFGFLVVFFQLGRQSRNAIAANTKNEAVKRQVEIYERTLETSRKAQDAATALQSFLRRFASELELTKLNADPNFNFGPPSARFPEYQKLGTDVREALIAVMFLIEAWQIVDQRITIFSRVISMGMSEWQKVWSSHPNWFVYGMPTPGHESKWTLPDPETLARLDYRIEQEAFQISRLSAWVSDFQVEMQILLLGGLFGTQLERRDPPDPTQFCVRLDRYDDIDKQINESDWGVEAATLEVEAWARFYLNK